MIAFRYFTLTITAALAFTVPAHADDLHQRFVTAVATKFLAPHYADLAKAAASGHDAWVKGCADPAKPDLPAIQAAHRALALNFARVQTFTLGPIGRDSTIERVYFWPERKNATAKGLAALMSGGNPITPDSLSRASAAAIGIPALEQLAFPDAATLATPAAQRCEAGIAVSQGLGLTLASIDQAWNGSSGYIAALAKGTLDPGLGSDWDSTATQMVTDFATGLIAVQDYKVEPILGKSIDVARPFQAEAVRSAETTAMIGGNIAGLRGFLETLSGIVDAAKLKSWDEALAALQTEATNLKNYPQSVTDPATRPEGEAFLDSIKKTRYVLENQFPQALGLSIGFNSLDGD